MGQCLPAVEVKVGEVFHRLTVLELKRFPIPSKPSNTRMRCLCQCSCGSEPKWIDKIKVASGITRSCGCIVVERCREQAYRNHERMRSKRLFHPKPDDRKRWEPTAEQKEQERIRRRNTRRLKRTYAFRTRTHGELENTLAGWCQVLGLSPERVIVAIDAGVPLAQALQLTESEQQMRLAQWVKQLNNR